MPNYSRQGLVALYLSCVCYWDRRTPGVVGLGAEGDSHQLMEMGSQAGDLGDNKAATKHQKL